MTETATAQSGNRLNESARPLPTPRIAVVGNPNVGKSVLFTRLTGTYATASNYPGTTVEVTRGRIELNGVECEVVDTPGMYSFTPVTEEERVAREILFDERPFVVLHVVDAKNLERMLGLALQLKEASLPTILVLNMLDEARSEGVEVNVPLLSERLGLPVVGTVSVTGEGFDELRSKLKETLETPIVVPPVKVKYPPRIENGIARAAALLQGEYAVSKRMIALLLFNADSRIEERVTKNETPATVKALRELTNTATHLHAEPLEYEIAIAQKDRVNEILAGAVTVSDPGPSFQEKLSRVLMNPVTGIPVLLLVLYWGLYKFVGGFGAGTVVDFLEGTVFEEHVNPFFVNLCEQLIPWAVLRDLLVGEYGLLTMGLRYSLGIILPIVAFFFLVFAIIEDSGYLPRLALLLDRSFKKIGLSGRAVIPMVLGFGCDTMATMVTRTLPTKRERLLSTLLLALAVPCSAQLGVILALLEGHPKEMLIWVGIVAAVFIVVGYVSAKVLPGEGPSFYMEVPPMRFPTISNVLTKTYVRIKWYLTEIIPFFLLASFLIWLGQLTGLFGLLIRLFEHPVQWIGLPVQAADVFLMGFFRRDYGAAGLYDMNKAGQLTDIQLVVACVALTLFLPCLAQLLMNVKERGWKTGVGISVIVLVLSFGVAFLLNLALTHG